jgi:hypothetical protein
MSRVARIELAGHRRAFGLLRSADERSIIAAYRYGEIVATLNRQGFTYEELGEDVDRSKYTVALYAKLFKKYDDEHDLLETARTMRTYDVSRLAGGGTAIQYQFQCTNCGSDQIKRRRKSDDTVIQAPKVDSVPMPSFGFGTGA